MELRSNLIYLFVLILYQCIFFVGFYSDIGTVVRVKPFSVYFCSYDFVLIYYEIL